GPPPSLRTLPRRARAASDAHRTHRGHVRNGPLARRRDEGGGRALGRVDDGVPAATGRRRALAQCGRGRARAARAGRRAVRGRSAVRATEEAREEGRRLISLNPQLLTIARHQLLNAELTPRYSLAGHNCPTSALLAC